MDSNGIALASLDGLFQATKLHGEKSQTGLEINRIARKLGLLYAQLHRVTVLRCLMRHPEHRAERRGRHPELLGPLESAHFSGKVDVLSLKTGRFFVSKVGRKNLAALGAQLERMHMNVQRVVDPYTHLAV